MAANADIDVRLKERGIENIYVRDLATNDIDTSLTNAMDTVAQAETRGAERNSDSNAASGEAFVPLVPAPGALHRTRSAIGEWITGIRRSTRPWRRAIRVGYARPTASRKTTPG